ncbi:MAG: hypothetical protein V3V20_07035 [Algisphaera sp.]
MGLGLGVLVLVPGASAQSVVAQGVVSVDRQEVLGDLGQALTPFGISIGGMNYGDNRMGRLAVAAGKTIHLSSANFGPI